MVSLHAYQVIVFLSQVSDNQEILIDENERQEPQSTINAKKLHGELRLNAGPGWFMEDPLFNIEPSLAFDLRDMIPLQMRFAAAIRLRLYDRDPQQQKVLRTFDWDEVGDFFTILRLIHYHDEFVFAKHGELGIDLRIGALNRMTIGHGSLVQGYTNSIDIDRQRSGVDSQIHIHGMLLDHKAEIGLEIAMGDIAGSQLIGTRIATNWAGAGLGLSVMTDPTAPHQLITNAGTLVRTQQNNLRVASGRGVVGLGLDIEYEFTDDWRFSVIPYLDLNMFPHLGKGLHGGIDSEIFVDKKRKFRLGLTGEFTFGDSDYDPSYFDLFYLAQRRQAQLVAQPNDLPSNFADIATPKYQFVKDQDLSGFGGYGGIRLSHQTGIYAETAYRYRPGPLGHTWENRLVVERDSVELSLVHAHRGKLGFNIIEPAGTFAGVDINVPIVPHVDITASAGWYFSMRCTSCQNTSVTEQTNEWFLGNGGRFLLGIAGYFDW